MLPIRHLSRLPAALRLTLGLCLLLVTAIAALPATAMDSLPGMSAAAAGEPAPLDMPWQHPPCHCADADAGEPGTDGDPAAGSAPTAQPAHAGLSALYPAGLPPLAAVLPRRNDYHAHAPPAR